MKTIAQELSSMRYPGRGILLGVHPDGNHAVIAYFIMGRSENSRNRVFVTEGDGIRTQAYDPSKMKDPHLIIYAPVRVSGKRTIVTNGDQTDTIFDGFAAGLTFEQALRSRVYEDDAPNFTPRISGLVDMEDGLKLSLHIIKKSAECDSAVRFHYDYEAPQAGFAKLIHTYTSASDALESFTGEPKTLTVPDCGLDAFTELVWNALDADNKISLFTRYIDARTGAFDTRVVNKYN